MSENITIIGASAGSGKTWTLCENYLASLSGGNQAQTAGVADARPEQVLATTFNKRTAAELAQRLRARILIAGMDEAALCVEDGYIGTVHSVCLALVQEFALEKGLSPDLQPLPEGDKERVFIQATAAAMQKHQEALQAVGHRLSMDAYQPYGKVAGLDTWEATVRNLCDLARSNGLQAEDLRRQGPENAKAFCDILPPPCTPKEGEDLRHELAAAVNKTLAAVEQDKEADACKALREWLQGADRQWQYWRELCDVKVGKKSNALFAPLKELASRYPCLPEFRADVTKYITGVFTCAADALEAYECWKKAYGLLDYNDMEALVLELLQDEGVAATLGERIAQVFVDEFQDTSPLQLAVFLRLAKLARHSVWVGDTKQAIYGFRGADPVLMQAAVRGIGHNPANDLKDSWRSRQCLVEFTNAFFTAAFGQYGYTPEMVELNIPEQRQPYEKQDAHAGRPSGLRHWQGDPKANAAVTSTALAERIAHVLRCCDAPEYQVRDKCSKQLRPLAASDIAVLCRSNAHCIQVAAALRQCGIAADVALKGLLRRPEVVMCLAAYRFCTDPRDSIAILELLRFVWPDMCTWLDMALAWGRDGPHGILCSMTKLGSELVALRPALRFLSPSEALHKVASVLDSVRLVERWGHQQQRLANVDMLHAMVLRYEEGCRVRHESCTHAGCIAWLMATEDAAQAPESGRNAVRVLTYHAAKGLEWPMVILCDLDNAARKNAAFGLHMCPPTADMDLDNLLADRKVHYWPWLGGRKQTMPSLVQERYEKHTDKEIFSRQARQEELRLLYVGMTRARDILVLYTHKKDTWLREALPEDTAWALPEAEAAYFKIGEKTFPVFVEDRAEAEGLAITPHVHPGFPHPPFWKKPTLAPRWLVPSSLPPAKAWSEYTIHTLDGVLVWHGEEEPQQVGNILHAWLGVDMPMLLGDADRPARLATFAHDWQVAAENAKQLPGVSERLHTALVEMATTADLGKITTYRVEWPIVQGLGQQFLSGRMDLLALCERGFVLIDHKFETATASSELYTDTVHTYSGQINAYVEALHAAGQQRILACLHLPAQGVLLRYAEGPH